MRETSKKILSRYEEPLSGNFDNTTENDSRKKWTAMVAEYKGESKLPEPLLPALLTVAIFLFAALTIVVATTLIWDLPLGSGTRQVVLNVLIGMLLSVPVLISLWAVLGGQTWIIRIPLATFCLLALLGTYFATMSMRASSIPSDVFLLIGGIALAVSAAIQIPAWIARARFGISITRKASGPKANKQFTIKQLLITTTIIAFLVPLLQWFATLKIFANFGMPLDEIFGFCGVFIVVLMFLTFLSLLLVFLPKLRVVCLCVLVFGITAIPFAVVPSIVYLMGRRFSNDDMMDMGINVFVFSLSNAVTVITVLSIYYAVGFRLRQQLD